jgi:hypothetical protein
MRRAEGQACPVPALVPHYESLGFTLASLRGGIPRCSSRQRQLETCKLDGRRVLAIQSDLGGGDYKMIRSAIIFTVSNYVLTFLVTGLIAAAISIARAPRPVTISVVVDKLLTWYVLFNIGVMYLVNFIFHVFFGQMAAAFIGWADSPFQFEVGTASLGFALAGFVAAFSSFDRRLIAVIGPSIFTLGAAVGHIQQMVTAHNFAPGNAGIIFYLDILIPLFGFALLWLRTGDRPTPRS